MITITPYSIGSFFKSNWKNIALILLVLFVFYQCNDSSDLQLANSQLKKDAEQHLKNAELFQSKNESLIANEQKYNDTIALLKSKESNLINQKKEIVLKSEKKIAEIKKFTSSQIANYIKTRYQAKESEVITQQNGTLVIDTISKQIIVDLQKGDSCEETIYVLEEQIDNKEQIEKQKDEIISNVKEQNVNLLSAIDEYKSANQLKQNALNNTEKLFKKERNKKNIFKITTVLAILGGGYLLVK